MEEANACEYLMENGSEFGLIDFMDEANFEQFIELIRGDAADPIVGFCPNYDCEHINGCLQADGQFGPNSDYLFDFSSTVIPRPNSTVNLIAAGDNDAWERESENEDDQSSAATTTTTTTTKSTTPTKKSTKNDRTRTLISERRRRGRMKEKLYALRSLVPNITKMDKASIVGDAVSYVQGLQMEAKRLKSEIAGLESTLTATEKYQRASVGKNVKKIQPPTTNLPVSKKIIQVDAFQIEENGFYVRLVCKKGQGVAVSLYRALETLNGFTVQSSNLITSSENVVLTLTLTVRECQMKVDLQSLKVWIATALHSQGFEFAALSA